MINAKKNAGVCSTNALILNAIFHLISVMRFGDQDLAQIDGHQGFSFLHFVELLLTYDLPRTGEDDPAAASSTQAAYTCAICRGVIKSLGVYFCVKCRYYLLCSYQVCDFKPGTISGFFCHVKDGCCVCLDDSHGKTHILYMSTKLDFSPDIHCNCCDSTLSWSRYECSNCRHF